MLSVFFLTASADRDAFGFPRIPHELTSHNTSLFSLKLGREQPVIECSFMVLLLGKRNHLIFGWTSFTHFGEKDLRKNNGPKDFWGYAMLCYAVLCYAMLWYAMLCHTMLCYAMLCYVMLCYAVLCCAMLWYYAMLCYAMQCYAMLCYVTVCYAILG